MTHFWVAMALGLAAAVPSASAANKYWDTSTSSGLQGGTGTWDTAATARWNTNVNGTAALTTWANGDAAFFQNFGTNTVTLSGLVSAASLSQASFTSSTTLSGGTFQLGAGGISHAGGYLEIKSALTLGVADAPWSVTYVGNQPSPVVISGNVGDGGSGYGFTKTGTGKLTLSGNNTFKGTVTLNVGTLGLPSQGALGGLPTLRFTGGTLQYANGNRTDYSGLFSPVASGQTIKVDLNGDQVTFASPITGAGGLTVLGGVLTLAANNTQAAGTTLGGTVVFSSLGNLGPGPLQFISGGLLLYAPGNTADITANGRVVSSSGGSGGIYTGINIDTNGNDVTFASPPGGSDLTKLGNGTLTLSGVTTATTPVHIEGGVVNYAFSAAAPTNLTPASSSLEITGAADLLLTGSPGGVNSQAFNGVTGSIGGEVNFKLVQNGAASLSASLGYLQPGIINFDLPANGTITTDSGTSGSILLQAGRVYNTVNHRDWAAKNGSAIVPFSSLPGGGYTPSTATTLANHADVASGVDTTLAASTSLPTLRFDRDEARAINVGAGNTLAVDSLLITPKVNTAGSNINGGTLRSTGTSGFLQILQNSSRPFTIGSVIGDSNGNNSVSLKKSGTGELILTANSALTGSIVVQRGLLTLAGAIKLGNGGSLGFGDGTVALADGGSLDVGTSDLFIPDGVGTRGTLNLAGTSSLSTKDLYVGYGPRAVGFVRQNGAASNVAAKEMLCVGYQSGSHGVYRLEAGNLQTKLVFVGQDGTGVFEQKGGSVVISGNYPGSLGGILFGLSYFTRGVGYLTGGTLSAVIDVAPGGRGELSIGGTAVVTATDVLLIGSSANNVGILNLLSGGVLAVPSMDVGNPTASPVAFVNFNGGTLRATGDAAAFLSDGLTACTLQRGGLVLDTNGHSVTVARPLVTPAGKGVDGIAVLDGGRYTAPPIVSIEGGGGVGATAVASLDADGALQGIAMTNPGTGYTSTPAVTLIGRGGPHAKLGTVALAANVGGGITKIGAGTLTLGGANTYPGLTQVNGGQLALTAAASLSGAGVSVAGNASLDVSALGTAGFLVGTGRTLVNNGTVSGNLRVDGTLQGAGTLNGALSVNATGLVSSTGGGTLTLNGAVTNNGTMRFTTGAVLDASGASSFVNNGVLDLISGDARLPANFVNGTQGVVLTARDNLRVRSVSRANGQVTVVAEAYTGHVYQLQRGSSPSAGSFVDLGAPQQGTTGTALTFTDDTPTPAQAFYRVTVDPVSNTVSPLRAGPSGKAALPLPRSTR